jgi:hypothetical protein
LLAIGKRTEAINIPISNHIAVSYQQPLIILLGSLIVLARARLPWHWKNKTIQGAMPSTPSGHGATWGSVLLHPGCGIDYFVVKIKMPSERLLRLAGHALTPCLISCGVPVGGSVVCVPCPCDRARARVINRSIIRAGFGGCGERGMGRRPVPPRPFFEEKNRGRSRTHVVETLTTPPIVIRCTF